MSQRVPLALSVTALVVAVLGATPLGEAALEQVVPVARFARNADKVDGIHASRTPKAGHLVPLRANKKLPASVIPPQAKGAPGAVGPKGEKGDPGVSGREIVRAESATNSTSPKFVTATCPSGKVPVGGGGFATGDTGNLGAVGNVALFDSHPISAPTPGWQTAATEVNATGGSWALSAYAMCVQAPSQA